MIPLPQRRSPPRFARAAALAALLLAALAVLSWPSPVDAEDRILIRGNYYRERSTRVLQPYISFSKDLPDERLTIGADYLMDVISTDASLVRGSHGLPPVDPLDGPVFLCSLPFGECGPAPADGLVAMESVKDRVLKILI